MNERIEKLRERINQIDKEIIKILGERMGIANEIGRVKKEIGAQVQDENREKELFALYQEWGKQYNIDFDLIKNIFSLVIKESQTKQI